MTDRMTTKEVADALGFSVSAVRAMAEVSALVAVRTRGRGGRGVRLFFDPAEVEAFKAGGAAGAEAYRAAKGKGRKARAS